MNPTPTLKATLYKKKVLNFELWFFAFRFKFLAFHAKRYPLYAIQKKILSY